MGIFLFLVFIGLVVAGAARSVKMVRAQGTSLLDADWQFNRKGAPLFALALLVLAALFSFTTVDAGNIGVIKSFGRPAGQLLPGPHFIRPWATMSEVTVQTRIVKPNEDAASHDLQVVHTEVTLAYHVDPPCATFVLVNLNNDAEARVINPTIFEAIKATTARYDVQQLISERALVRDGIESFVKARLAPYCIVAETTSITDFRFSKEFEQAIESKVTAQQNAEKASNDLKRIEIQAQQQIAQAKGEAEALRMQKEQITPELLQLRVIEMMSAKWDGHLPGEYISAGGGTLPMMDVLGKHK